MQSNYQNQNAEIKFNKNPGKEKDKRKIHK
jgi:hypothetical protein